MSWMVRINKYSPVRLRADYKRIPLRAGSLNDRMKDASRIGFICSVSDVIMVSLIDSYIHQAYRYAADNGLMRFRLKSAMNELRDATHTMQVSADRMDTEMYMDIMFALFPFASKRFVADGGGVKDEFVAGFERTSNRVVARMHDVLLDLANGHRLNYPELCAHLLLITTLSNLGNQMYNVYAAKQDDLMAGEVVLERRKSKHYDKYLHLAQIILRQMGMDMKQMVSDDVVQSTDSLYQEAAECLGIDKMEKLCSEVAFKGCMTYIEYAVACLRVDLEVTGRVDEEYLKPVVGLIGQRDAGYLIRFLRRLPMPEEQDVDLWEYAQQLPKAGRSKTLDRLRRKSLAILNQEMN